MARILLAWELGGGNGHVVRFERLIREFQNRGHTIIAAIPYAKHADRLSLAQDCIKIVPQWPSSIVRRRDPRGISWITYGDMLASIIFTDANEIAERISTWRRVYDETKADVVIADYAPGAVLAARDFMDCVNIGDGYTLPPHEMDNFPLLWRAGSTLKHQEADVAERISSALIRFGATPLVNYPDMNAATAHATMTVPVLDVYSEFRTGGWLGAGPFTFPESRPESRGGLFAYFYETRQFDTNLIGGLVQSRVGGTIMIPNILRRNRKVLSEAGFQTPKELQPLNEVLENARVLVHHGGMGTAVAGIAKGVPQLIIHGDLEKYHIGKAIAGAGAGLELKEKTATAQQICEAIQTLVHDPAYLDRALQLAVDNRDLLSTSSISALADLTERVV